MDHIRGEYFQDLFSKRRQLRDTEVIRQAHRQRPRHYFGCVIDDGDAAPHTPGPHNPMRAPIEKARPFAEPIGQHNRGMAQPLKLRGQVQDESLGTPVMPGKELMHTDQDPHRLPLRRRGIHSPARWVAAVSRKHLLRNPVVASPLWSHNSEMQPASRDDVLGPLYPVRTQHRVSLQRHQPPGDGRSPQPAVHEGKWSDRLPTHQVYGG